MAEYDRIQKKQESRAVANNRAESKQMKWLRDNGTSFYNTIQMLKVKDYTDCNGYLNGDGMIRNPPNVFYFVDLLKQGKPLPAYDPITAVKNVDLVEDPDEDGHYINREEISESDDKDKLPTIKKHILMDGHHRFAAYIEAGMQLPYIQASEGNVDGGYNWNVCNGVDYEKE